MYTEDLNVMGLQDYKQLKNLLTAWFEGDGLPARFEEKNVVIGFNTHSCDVFLTNCDSQVAMLNEDGDIHLLHSCPECGASGFNYELRKHENQCCDDYLDEFYS